MRKKKYKPRIPNPCPEPETERLQFSFKHLDENHPKFKIESCSSDYLRALLLQIKVYSDYTEEQFTDQNNNDHRHWNFWRDTTETNGFTNLSDEIQNEYSWQFALNPQSRKAPGANWRVHGMLVGNVFYIVWLDPQHKLAPRNGRNVFTGNRDGNC